MNEENSRGEKSTIAKREEEILARWQEKKIFTQTDQKASPQGIFTFYDGPPFATGLPHFGNLLASIIKDVIPRYKTMQGYHVPRRWGWDCHGLPIENLIEKEFNLKTKKDIEDYGVGNFNERARESVLRYADEWKKIIPRLGRFVDMEDDYRTMDPSYTESIWWIFKNLYDQDLIYEGYKSMQICPRCETTLSNFEVNQGYKDVTDISVYVKFELVDQPKTFIVAWTTTPWTLPGNVALAVGSEINYCKIKILDDFLIVAKDRLNDVFKNEKFEIIGELKGADLIGKKYLPVFDYYSKDETLKNRDNGWQIYGADFVTTEDGTGVVHIAPAFGEDDMNLGQKENLPFVQPVAMNGTFKPEMGDGLAGLSVKPKAEPQKTDIEILKLLAVKGALLAKEKIVHSYPHCWRCDTPLLNYATSSWFVKVTAIKDKLVVENRTVNWVPDNIKEGRFGKWLEGARDWAISRTRYWGAPLPVWRCDQCQEKKVFGSLAELQQAGQSVKNNYWVMRHGQAVSNLDNRISFKNENKDGLTAEGKNQVMATAKKLQTEKIDLVISSPFRRAKETAEILAQELGVPIELADGLREINVGVLDGQSWTAYEKELPTIKDKIEKAPDGGETVMAMKARVMAVLFDLEDKYLGKNILIVSHGLPLRAMVFSSAGIDNRTLEKIGWEGTGMTNAEVRPLNFKSYPHNANFDLDYHRPYIDEVKMSCACGGDMKRVLDVFDCWFESGSMPYGQNHFLGQAQSEFNPETGLGFPADFIAEGQDQTRGWFYTLIVLGVGLFGKSPFKNVVVNGMVQAEDGQKMSKHLKNYSDPQELFDKYGADAVRLYMLSSPVVHAEDLNFSEKGVGEISRKIIARLLNVVSFLELYGNVTGGEISLPSSHHVLDRWIISRLNELIAKVESELELYKLDRVIWALDGFIDDLSNWYLRRSRDRFRSEETLVREEANNTLLFVLIETAKVLAPFAPFVAEDIYLRLTKNQSAESVHLTTWPTKKDFDQDLTEKMSEVRKIVTLGLELRMSAGIKVRQPLASLTLRENLFASQEDLLDLIKDELNIKEIICDSALAEPLQLETTISSDLQAEGLVRELIRLIQDWRKQKKLVAGDKINVKMSVDNPIKVLVEKYLNEIKQSAGLLDIDFSTLTSEQSLIGEIADTPIYLEIFSNE